jgi:hypothetical protein
LERSCTLLADVITVVVKGGHSGWVAIQVSYNIIRGWSRAFGSSRIVSNGASHGEV